MSDKYNHNMVQIEGLKHSLKDCMFTREIIASGLIKLTILLPMELTTDAVRKKIDFIFSKLKKSILSNESYEILINA